MRLALVIGLACSLAGCSTFLVHGPPAVEPGTDPSTIHCTESGIVPALDALGGAAAIGTAAGGVLLEQVRESHKPEHFTLYFAGPLLAVAIAYFWSASQGTDHVETCTEVKAKAGAPSTWQVQPIDQPGKPTPATDSEVPP